MSNGIAMRTTSNGTLTITSPFRENITMIVNSNAIKVIGLIFGMNTFHTILALSFYKNQAC